LDRIQEAEVLFVSKNYGGAYYLAGYAVECALKSLICKSFQRHTLPPKGAIYAIYTHNLEDLAKEANVLGEIKANGPLFSNWQIIKDWKETSR